MPGQTPPIGLRGVVDVGAFLATLGAKSGATRATYAAGLRNFAEWSDGPVSETTLRDYYLALLERYGPGGTARTYLSAARAYIEWSVIEKHLLIDHHRAELLLKKARPRRPRPRLEQIPDVGPLFAAMDDVSVEERGPIWYRDRALLEMLRSTGMRREECATLPASELLAGDLEQARVIGKGGKVRLVFFDRAAASALRTWLPLKPAGVPTALSAVSRRQPMSPKTVWARVAHWSGVAGVRIATHDFRRHFASRMLDRGVSLDMIQAMLGHSSPETTSRLYARHRADSLRQAHRQASGPRAVQAELWPEEL